MRPTQIRVLLLEDQDSDAVLCERELKRAAFDVQLLTVDTPLGFETAHKLSNSGDVGAAPPGAMAAW